MAAKSFDMETSCSSHKSVKDMANDSSTIKDHGCSQNGSVQLGSPKLSSELLDPYKNSSRNSHWPLIDSFRLKWCWLLQSEQLWSHFYLVTWFLLNIVITLYSKAVFSVYKFPYPMLMTSIHMWFTTLGVFVSQWVGLHTSKSLPPEMRLTIFWFSVVFSVNIWLSNASLLAVSVNLHQVIRTIIPLCTMLISFCFFGQRYPMALLPPVLLVIIGVVFTVWGDFNLDPWGLLIVFLGCFFSSLKGIITQKTQVGSLTLSSLDLLRYLCPLAFVQLVLLATWMGETSRLIVDSNITFPLVVHLIFLGWVAFALNFVSFRSAALSSPLTLNIAGNVKQVCTCLLSLVFFGGIISIALILGIVGTAVGAYWYSREMTYWLNPQKSKSAKTATEPDLEQTDEYEGSTTASLNAESELSFVELKEETFQQQRNRLINAERKIGGIIEV